MIIIFHFNTRKLTIAQTQRWVTYSLTWLTFFGKKNILFCSMLVGQASNVSGFKVIYSFVNILSNIWLIKILSSVFDHLCLFGFFRGFHPTREFFTHLETLPYLVMGHNFLHILGTYMDFHWAVGLFYDSRLVWHGPTFHNSHLRGPVTLTLVAECFAVELLLPDFSDFSEPTGDRIPIPRMWGEFSTTTPPRRCFDHNTIFIVWLNSNKD